MKVYLASTSKFKSEILNKVGIKHTCLKGYYDEVLNGNDVYASVISLSKGKANTILNLINDAIVIGLDTIVKVNDTILEKPVDKVEAKKFVKMCSDSVVSVITGVCVIDKKTNKTITNTSETLVYMKDISDEEVNHYLENEKDALYASGFIMENYMSNFISKIEGSYYNILGLPNDIIYESIKKLGYSINDIE